MKIYFFLFASHAAAVLASGSALLITAQVGGPALWGIVGVAVCATTAIISLVASRQMLRSLSRLQHFVTSGDDAKECQTGIDEFDRTARMLGEQIREFEEIAANNQEQSRDVQAVLAILNRRTHSGPASNRRLREVLSGIGNSMVHVLRQAEQQTDEVAKSSQSIVEDLETQSKAVIKTSTYVEQLYASIDSVSTHAGEIETVVAETDEASSRGRDLVQQLQSGIEQIRAQAHQSEQTLRSLSDPSRQISTIVETISDLAARTDMLALNASIESIRAGEHGRGFAIVADEVRKLAEQSSQATREISALIESVQLATQESISSIAKERSKVEAELELVEQVGSILGTLTQQAATSLTKTTDIAATTREQLTLTQNIVLALEQISNLARSTRNDAESVSWTTKSLVKIHHQFDDSVDRFRRCSAQGGTAENPPTQQRNEAPPEGGTRTVAQAERELEEATKLVELS